jgi:hypothetical protein
VARLRAREGAGGRGAESWGGERENTEKAVNPGIERIACKIEKPASGVAARGATGPRRKSGRGRVEVTPRENRRGGPAAGPLSRGHEARGGGGGGAEGAGNRGKDRAGEIRVRWAWASGRSEPDNGNGYV